MFEFAQTNLQLLRQMDEQEYYQQDRERVASAYRQLMPMFSGLYRENEKSFLAHLVGTASILVSGRLQVERVLAGLLHAVYMAGDFRFPAGNTTDATQTTTHSRAGWRGGGINHCCI
ncbi:MAG: hypothetical protein IPG64_22590 [Haliea sp.]|nr:hypothetical protein [Haliea sp.]